MLPAFDDFGNLPAGIHPATLAEVVDRFGVGSPEREVEGNELLDFITWCRQCGVRRVIINGSFVTGTTSPNDMDVVILPDVSRITEIQRQLDADELQWPFLQIVVAADDLDLERWANRDFGSDRNMRRKGVVEVMQ